MPYSKIDPEHMILRDHLAYDRTVLANERTLLSYLRTAIALVAAGGTLVKVLPDEPGMLYTGIVLLTIGCLTAGVGVTRFIRVKARLSLTYRQLDSD